MNATPCRVKTAALVWIELTDSNVFVLKVTQALRVKQTLMIVNRHRANTVHAETKLTDTIAPAKPVSLELTAMLRSMIVGRQVVITEAPVLTNTCRSRVPALLNSLVELARKMWTSALCMKVRAPKERSA